MPVLAAALRNLTLGLTRLPDSDARHIITLTPADIALTLSMGAWTETNDHAHHPVASHSFTNLNLFAIVINKILSLVLVDKTM